MNLLDNLCKVNKQQGGTIHQFLAHNPSYKDVDDFQKSYDNYIGIGIVFESKASFDKLAKQYHITINWEG